MIHEKKHFIKCLHARVGGGGFYCGCCIPEGKVRVVWYRMVKRSERQKMKKQIQTELHSDSE